MTTSVLYDQPGPKARRRSMILSVIAAIVLAAALIVALQRLQANGQLDADKWGSLINPSHENFQQVWDVFLIPGIKNTLLAAGISIVTSLVVGTAIGVARLMAGKVGRIPLVGMIELLRGLPVVISIYFASRVLPALGADLSFMPGGAGLWYVVIGLTAYNSVIFAEILRAGVAALPRGQREAALAVGLTPSQTMFQVLLPQALRIMLPAVVSQIIVILKDSSLAGLLAIYGELLYQAKPLALALRANFPVYVFVGFLFIVINYLLSLVANWMERALSRGRRSGGTPRNEADGPPKDIHSVVAGANAT